MNAVAAEDDGTDLALDIFDMGLLWTRGSLWGVYFIYT